MREKEARNTFEGGQGVEIITVYGSKADGRFLFPTSMLLATTLIQCQVDGWIPFSHSSHFTKNIGMAKKATEHKYVYSRGIPARVYITSKHVRGEGMPLFGC